MAVSHMWALLARQRQETDRQQGTFPNDTFQGIGMPLSGAFPRYLMAPGIYCAKLKYE